MVCLRDHHLAFFSLTTLQVWSAGTLVGWSVDLCSRSLPLKGLKERDMIVGHHMSQDPPGKGADWSYCRPCSCSARFYR